MSRSVKIFLSSPSDVAEECAVLKALVSEINDVLAFIAPHQDIELQTIHYTTDVFPDAGSPQQVVDRQIPPDYDIHFGVMWKRCGTPTPTADSGTVHEFDKAYERRQRTGRPVIMFYFSNEPVPMMGIDTDQLNKVLKFKERLGSIGLTGSYPNRSAFREHARQGLLRAIASILKDAPAGEALPRMEPAAAQPPADMIGLAALYERTRAEQPPGRKRTQAMTAIFGDMIVKAPQARHALATLADSASPGQRLAAVAILQAFPEVDRAAWLADRLDPASEAPFVGYQSGVALMQAARSLPASADATLEREIARAKSLAEKNPDDPPRIRVLGHALEELELKRKRRSSAAFETPA